MISTTTEEGKRDASNTLKIIEKILHSKINVKKAVDEEIYIRMARLVLHDAP